jgi:iron(III) transport system substrate-binding protein
MKISRSAVLGVMIGFIVFSFAPISGLAQSKQGMISLTREQIMEGAKKEGKVRVTPGHDESAIPTLVKAFQKKYPFIQTTWGIVGGTDSGQRQLFEMAAGTSNVDAFSPSSAFFSDYFRKDLIKKYDFRAMSKAGHLKIPLEMIDDSGVVAWLGTNTGVLAYNTKLVPPEKAPKSWENCLDPQWKGKFSVDTKPNVFAWLVPRWGEEKLLSFARRLKENNPVWARGNTRNITALSTGEVVLNCGMYIQVIERTLRKDQTLPIKMVIPDPFPMSYHEPEAVYANSKNPHAALLWIEFIASREGQELAETIETGRGSFLVEGTLAHKLAKGKNISLCADDCRYREDKLMERIAVEAWGLPKLGAGPK